MWDHTATAWLLEAVRAGRTIGAVRFVPEEGATLAPPGLGRVMGAEQSNTSVVFGEQTIMKLFRRLNPGVNPDLELHRALRSVGSTEVAALQGAVEGTLGGEPTTLAMLQDFAGNSADGWAMALASVRDLFAEADLRADEVGGDFAGEASRIGETVAIVHAELAQALGTTERDPAELAAAWSVRLDAAARDAPVLAPYVDAVRAVYDAVAGLPDPILAHRVHGDLHLGQLLRTPHGLVDPRLRGRAVGPASRAAASGLADARRRRDAPLVRLCGILPAAVIGPPGVRGRPDRAVAAALAREGVGRPQPRRVLRRLRRCARGSTPVATARCCGRSSWTRPSTRSSTRPAAGRAGCRSHCHRSSG